MHRLMGVLTPPSFSPSTAVGNTISPRWVFPLPFQAGLYFECANGEKWYLGFDLGPHQLGGRTIDGLTSLGPVPLRTPHNPRDLVSARILQQGNQLKLQVRLWRGTDPAEGCLYELLRRLGAIPFINPKLPGKLDGTDILGDVMAGPLVESTDPYAGWLTLTTRNTRVTRVGIGARHSGGTCFARIRAEFWGQMGNSISAVPLSGLSGTNLLNQNAPIFANSVLADGSLVLPYRIMPGVPIISFEHTAAVDRAPRLTAPSPTTGDFSFGASLSLLDSCILNWAGGTGIGKTYIGTRQQFRFDQFDFATAWGSTAGVRRNPPPENAYKFLFCFISENAVSEAELIPKLGRLDLNRRAWESCLPAMTQGQRFAITSIP